MQGLAQGADQNAVKPSRKKGDKFKKKPVSKPKQKRIEEHVCNITVMMLTAEHIEAHSVLLIVRLRSITSSCKLAVRLM
jgi:hypothetical protein